jgi:putative selenium metabolism hydrolase
MNHSRASISLCQELVRIPSPSGAEGALMQRVLERMQALGFDETWQDRVGNTVGVLRGTKPGTTRRLLVDIHADTVAVTSAQSWHHDPYSGDLENGRIYGRGACDIKSGLASALTGLAALPRQDFCGEIWVAATVCEEMIEGAATRVVMEKGLPDFCVVVEPTGLQVGIAQKGRAGVRLQTSGIPAHTSRAELGVNAVYKMLPAIQAVREMTKRNDPAVGREVFELVEVVSEPFPGNSIVPDGCRARVDCRLLLGETAQSLLRRFQGAVGSDVAVDLWPVGVDLYTGIRLEQGDFHQAWSIDLAHPLVKAALHALRKLELPPDTCAIPYCCNASATTQAGAPTIVFGPGDIAQAHTIDEWIDASQLPLAAQALQELAAILLNPADSG